MIISCMGHAKFVIELDNGLRIVTDPYDASCGYPVTANPADVVLVSHQHHDHNAVETIPGQISKDRAFSLCLQTLKPEKWEPLSSRICQGWGETTCKWGFTRKHYGQGHKRQTEKRGLLTTSKG